MNKGKFVTIEGCEGAGKSTQLRLIKEYCEANKIDAVFTREPGGTLISESIREIILNPSFSDMDDMTELLLYNAARRQHTARFILPAIQSGKTVFCDRYCDSTMAYQGYARGLNKQTIQELNRLAMGKAEIDCTIFIDIDPVKGFARKGGSCGDRLEKESLNFHSKVYKGFVEIAKNNPQRVASISAEGSVQNTHGKIIAALKERGIL